MDGFREEIQLKSVQHASAQSLMNNMRDKKARERCESLEAELADVHRLLSEPRRRDYEAVACCRTICAHCRCQDERILEAVIESEIVRKKSMPWSNGAGEKRKSSRSRSER
jgi:hypothetical protein